jgi:hypothetical protein
VPEAANRRRWDTVAPTYITGSKKRRKVKHTVEAFLTRRSSASDGRRGLFFAGGYLTLLFLTALLVLSSPAAAAAPEFFSRIGESGSGAGQLSEGRGVAADPVSGHVLVADWGNNRINEFTAWGEFVKAWGWGVRDGGKELQTCTEATGCLKGLAGGGNGQLRRPNGITVGPGGDVYVFERENQRVQKFDATGKFLLAFGGDVVANGPGNSASDEEQELTVAASSGTFRLSFEDPLGGGSTALTPPLAYNASAAAVEAALNAISTIAGHDGSVTVTGGPGDAMGSSPYTIRFGGGLAGDDVPQLKVDRSGLGPASIGARLVCSTDAEAETVKYAWSRNGTLIPSATASTYSTTPADEGKAIQCQTFAFNADAGITSTSTSYIAPPEPASALPIAPSYSERPRSSDLLTVGGPAQTLSCNENLDNWSGATSFSYAWYRNAALVAAANANTYEVQPADIAAPATFQCMIIATNAGGTVTTLSRPYETIPPPAGDPGYKWSESTTSMEPLVTTKVGGSSEICVAAKGDLCKAGDRGKAPGQYNAETIGDFTTGNYIAAGPDGTIFVADRNRLQKFDASGVYLSQIPLPEEGYPGALAIDPQSGDLYFSFGTLAVDLLAGHALRPSVYRLNPSTGAVLDVLPVGIPFAIATDAAGNVYVFDAAAPGGQSGNHIDRVLEFSSSGDQTASFAQNETRQTRGIAVNTVTNAGEVDVYVINNSHLAGETAEDDSIHVYGPPPEKWLPPAVAPQVGDQFAISVGTREALLKAQINPRFWADTHYYVQYGTFPCSTGGCAEQPAAPGAKLTAKVTNALMNSAGIFLTGLEPDTTYHYRFVAQSGGGGPVFGPDRTLRTFRAPAPSGESCPNQVFRNGPSSRLPDCRAYEMVSPLDKNNGDVSALRQVTGYSTALDQSAVEGDALTFTSYRSFGDAQGGAFANQYLARRGPDGWGSLNLSPPRERSFFGTRLSLESEFKAFSADLSQAWLLHDSEPTLDLCAPGGFADLYRRANVDEGSYRALSCATPAIHQPFVESSLPPFYPELQGFSDDGSVAVFRANDKLTPDASEAASTLGLRVFQLYVSYGDGQLRLVNVLPNGQVAAEDSSAGTANVEMTNRFHNVSHAVSADGSRVFWSASASQGAEGQGPGKIYLRLNATQPQSALDGSGKCSEPQMACTIAVSQSVSSKPARFHIADPEGTKAVFSINESGSGASDLYEFSVPKRKATLIAHKVRGSILGAGEDASRLYFASEEVLTSGSNVQGQSPSPSKPNVYLYDANAEGTNRYRFVATLSALDAAITTDRPSDLERVPVFHTPRVTPSGDQLLFTSTASLTGYDNHDARSGEADIEVFHYDAEENGGQGLLRCISCNPSSARPAGRRVRAIPGSGQEVPVAAMIPLPQTQLYSPRALSEDGQRAFFNSYDSLVLSDTNGKEDVYQWEAPGKGTCSESSPTYSPPNGGCLALISSGESPADSEFLDASASGDDVFFTTDQSLLVQDYGLIDAYDARVEGGYPPPAGPPAACEGEACQGPLAPPDDPTPASSSFQGAGNAQEGKARSRCAKGKVRRKGRCTSTKRQHKRANRNRRTGR